MTHLTKQEAANLLVFLERGAHAKLAGLRNDDEITLYHSLRMTLIAICQAPDALPPETPKEQP